MSIKITSLVWERFPAETQSELLVMLALADWSNDEGLSWPSIPRLAGKSRISERGARNTLHDLRVRNVISYQDNSGGKGKSNRYLINVKWLQTLQPLQCLADKPNPANPATVAPFRAKPCNTNPETVAPFDGKPCNPNPANPANCDTKPCKAIAPKPSIDTSIDTPKEQSAPSRKAGSPKQPNPEVALFIEEWCEDYRQQFGKPYVVSGAKDGAAIKRLLASTGLGPYELMEVAHRAWACPEEPKRFFWCPKANTIAIFASRWNEITTELDKAGKFAHKGEQQHADLAGVTYGLA